MDLFTTLSDRGLPGFNPVQHGRQFCEPGHKFGPAQRTYFLLHYIVAGKGTFETDGRKYHLTRGDIFIIRPFEVTVYKADMTDPWQYVWLGFDCPEDYAHLFTQDVLHCPQAGEIFLDSLRVTEMGEGKNAFLCSKIWELVSLLTEENRRSATRDYITEAVNLIRTNFSGNLTVQQMADTMGLDRSYFSHVFKTATGLSPKDYLIRYRMERAAVLMTKHGANVTTAAASVGYTDAFLFSKMFKKVYGIAPTAYVFRENAD